MTATKSSWCSKILALLGCFLLLWLVADAQCPDNKLLRKRLTELQTASASIDDQLKELLRYDSLANFCGRRDSTHEFLKRFIGIKYYFRSDFNKALEYYRQANRIIEENANQPYINPQQLVSNYYWMSIFYDSLHNVPERISAMDTCIAQFMRLNVPANLAVIRAISERVEYYFDVGDYYKSLDYARESGNLCLEYIANNPVKNTTELNIARSILEYSDAWYVKVRLVQKQFGELERYLHDKVRSYAKAGFKPYLAYAYASLAELYSNKGEQENATHYFRLALRTYGETGDRFSCKQMWNSLGTDLYFRQLKDHGKALECYRTALRYNTASDPRDAVERLNIYANMGNVYVQQQRFDSAFFYYNLAFTQIKKGADENYIVNAPLQERVAYKKVHLLASLMLDKADAYLARYRHRKDPADLKEAVRIYRVADRFLDMVKAEQSDLDSKLFWRRGSRRLYEHAIEATYTQGNMEDAFYFFEKSKAVLLNDQLKLQRGLRMEDVAKISELRRRATQVSNQQKAAGADPGLYDELGHELFRITRQLDNLEKSIKQRNPMLYQSMVDTSFMRIKDVQQVLLKDHEALLEIFRGETAVYVLLILKNKVHLNKVSRKEFDSRAAAYISFISDRSEVNRSYGSFLDVSHQLYQLIFGRSGVPAGRIIISPDGQYFPFESLVVNTDKNAPEYFISDHAVSYTYSARFLQNSFPSAQKSGYGFLLGVAPVEYAAHLKLTPLRGSDGSLEKIRGDFGKFQGLIGNEASRDNFLRQFSRYTVIQLYTHASDSSRNNEPVIYFADAPLYLSELIPGDHPATRLVVLSACETGLGKLYQGEGVFSFNRGFAAMGIPSSVSSLWQVENRPTYRITELFHQYLASGLPLDVALQKAKLEYLETEPKEKRLPYYWAASILVGKTDAIAEPRTSSIWNWILMIGVLIIAGSLIYVLFRKNRKP
ncbi:MAG TPA: CHAT domain-containing tetratricopeptide repeat protein [Chitinophagaceae bacterium]|nr:CHAT domain-containing tetratricopeptide repeat protein [Chitinophagaceae bacterium]